MPQYQPMRICKNISSCALFTMCVENDRNALAQSIFIVSKIGGKQKPLNLKIMGTSFSDIY